MVNSYKKGDVVCSETYYYIWNRDTNDYDSHIMRCFSKNHAIRTIKKKGLVNCEIHRIKLDTVVTSKICLKKF